MIEIQHQSAYMSPLINLDVNRIDRHELVNAASVPIDCYKSPKHAVSRK